MPASPAHRTTFARHVAPRRGARRVVTALAVTLAVVLVTGFVGAFVAYYKLNNNITEQDLSGILGDDRPAVIAEADEKPLNILVMGSDRRAPGKNVAGERSDTTILLHLAADRKSAVVVSIPRDSIVDIPRCMREDGTSIPARPQQMFNTAFSSGGAACTIRTVEAISDIRIDHHVVVDFRGFRGMVNALDGVEVCVPEAVYDRKSRLDLEAGRQIVHGDQALAYVRTRYGLGNGGDLSRIERQQAFLSSMVTKVQSSGLLLRPDRLYNFLAAATQSLTTDPGLSSLNELRKLAQDVRGLKSSQIRFVTVPNEPYPADPNRVQFTPAAKALWTALRFDRPLPGQERKARQGTRAPDTGPPLRTPPERIHVEVLNGSGVPGAATRLAERLQAEGFVVTGIGTAARSDYTTTEVRHDPAYDESGRTLGAAVEGATVVEDLSLGSTLLVVVGADQPKVVPVRVAGSTATPEPDPTLTTRTASEDICS